MYTSIEVNWYKNLFGSKYDTLRNTRSEKISTICDYAGIIFFIVEFSVIILHFERHVRRNLNETTRRKNSKLDQNFDKITIVKITNSRWWLVAGVV